jgi:putative iron-regulated protein
MGMHVGRSALGAACAVLATIAVGFAAVSSLGATATAEPDRNDTAAVLKSYAEMAHAVYSDSLAGARALQTAIDALLANPGLQTLAAARKAWIDARVPYLQSEAFRFTNPIVDAWEGKVNAWPLDEGLIDYVASTEQASDNPLFAANIVASKVVRVHAQDVDAGRITAELLREMHEAGGLRPNVATGYHAIEFLLWGQDLNGTGPGAGNRPHTDYDLAACTNGNCDRRAEFLRVAAQLLVDDLAWMVAQWQPEGAAYRHIVTLPGERALVAIFSGIASLSYGELAGERMKLGLLLHDPEEEHDCFSDNSHNSHFWDAVGIENVYLGRYRRTDGTTVVGPSVSDLVKAKSPAADAEVRRTLSLTLARVQVIVDKAKDGTAFDQLIAEGSADGNRIVQSAIDALLAQTAALRRAVAALDLKGLTVLDSDSLRAPGAVTKRN